MNKIAMVIVNYNDYETTKTLLDNVKDYQCLTKIVVVDNHSTDHSYQNLKKLEDKKIVILENKKSKSYASGLNLGAKYLIKELGKCNIIFSNSDIIIKKEADLIKLSKDTEKFNIGVVGPIINEHKKLNRGWPLPTIKQEIIYNLPLISRYFKKKYSYKEEHYNEELVIVGAVSGCLFLVNSELLKKINYFDETTHLYYEENILAKKTEKTNYQIAVDTKVEVIHNHSVTIDKIESKISKYKILKTSQRYFVKEYLKANWLEMFFLWTTNKLSLIILYIRCFVKK